MKRCQDYTEEMEKAKFVRLSFTERMGISFHKAICPKCREYFKDSETLDSWITKRFKDHSSTVSFSAEEKAKLKALLKKD